MEKHLEGERRADLTLLDITRVWLERLRIACQHLEDFFFICAQLVDSERWKPLAI